MERLDKGAAARCGPGLYPDLVAAPPGSHRRLSVLWLENTLAAPAGT